jgi:hypothetical protein
VTRYVIGCIGHIGIAPLPDTGRHHIGEDRVLWPRYRYIPIYIVFIGIPIYRAAAATAHCTMHRGPEAFTPFHGPSGDVLRPQWEALHDGARYLWRPDAREAGPDSLGTIAISRRSAQLRADALMDSYDPSTDGGKHPRTPS